MKLSTFYIKSAFYEKNYWRMSWKIYRPENDKNILWTKFLNIFLFKNAFPGPDYVERESERKKERYYKIIDEYSQFEQDRNESNIENTISVIKWISIF